MTHDNRGRLSIDLNGNGRLYTNTVPSDSTVLGTVTRDGFTTGALVRLNKTGLYVQVNNGVLRNLDGRKVVAAIGTIGRPNTMTDGKKVCTYLDSKSVEIARSIGSGNVSEGIRKALNYSNSVDFDVIRMK